MSTTCTRCDGSGFLNLEQIDDPLVHEGGREAIQRWISENPTGNDVQACDCCADDSGVWYGIPGEHYNSEDPRGMNGPYAYNGGLCECD